MKLLVSNVGSTSLKFKLFEMPEETVLCTGKIERVGSCDSAIFEYKNCLSGAAVRLTEQCVPGYAEGIRLFLDYMAGADGVIGSAEEIDSVGFKTVLSKGYYGVHELTEEVLQGMRDYLFVAPAHNAPYLEAIDSFRSILPGTAMVGVFETAFHTTIPEYRRLYAIPYEWYEKYGIKKMGYHGASHGYIAQESAKRGRAEKVISCHLGGSCSVCAIENGKSVDTSFGFSLQTGVLHANRAGDTDSYIVPFLLNEGLSMDEIFTGLGKKGGLLGLSGVSNDLRDIENAAAQGNERAQTALDVFVCSVVRFIGMFYAELGGLDQLVFTGGIGENSAYIRERICRAVAHLGIELDTAANASCRDGRISADDSRVTVSVIPANEELGVARQTYNCILGR